MPNDSAPVKRDGVSHSSYFSVPTAKYRPTSVRNKVIYSKRTGNSSLLCNSLFSAPNHKRSLSIANKSTDSSASRTKRQKLETNAIELDPIIIPTPTFKSQDQDSSPFSLFCRTLVGQDAVLKWRIHSPALDVVVMNDICLESGKFQKNSFVHVSKSENSVYFCTCRMFTAGLRMKSNTETHHNNCCHVRFFAETISARYSFLFSDNCHATSVEPVSTLDSKLISSLQSLNIPIVKLDKHDTHHRFSVLSKDLQSASFVKLNGKRFSCMDGKCRASSGHTRKATLLGDDSTCEHLQHFNSHTELWVPLLPEEELSESQSTKVLWLKNNSQTHQIIHVWNT